MAFPGCCMPACGNSWLNSLPADCNTPQCYCPICAVNKGALCSLVGSCWAEGDRDEAILFMNVTCSKFQVNGLVIPDEGDCGIQNATTTSSSTGGGAGGVGGATTMSTSTSSTVPTAANDAGSLEGGTGARATTAHHGLSTGQKIGIGVGVGLGLTLLLLLLLACLCWRRRQSRRGSTVSAGAIMNEKAQSEDSSDHEDGAGRTGHFGGAAGAFGAAGAAGAAGAMVGSKARANGGAAEKGATSSDGRAVGSAYAEQQTGQNRSNVGHSQGGRRVETLAGIGGSGQDEDDINYVNNTIQNGGGSRRTRNISKTNNVRGDTGEHDDMYDGDAAVGAFGALGSRNRQQRKTRTGSSDYGDNESGDGETEDASRGGGAGHRLKGLVGLNRNKHDGQQADDAEVGGTSNGNSHRTKGFVGGNRAEHDDQQADGEDADGARHGGTGSQRVGGFIGGFSGLNRNRHSNGEVDGASHGGKDGRHTGGFAGLNSGKHDDEQANSASSDGIANQGNRDFIGSNRDNYDGQQADSQQAGGAPRGGTAGQRAGGFVGGFGGLNRNQHNNEQADGASGDGKAHQDNRGFAGSNRKIYNDQQANGEDADSAAHGGIGSPRAGGFIGGLGGLNRNKHNEPADGEDADGASGGGKANQDDRGLIGLNRKKYDGQQADGEDADSATHGGTGSPRTGGFVGGFGSLKRNKHNNEQVDGASNGGKADQRTRGFAGVNRNKHDDEEANGALHDSKASQRTKGFIGLSRDKRGKEEADGTLSGGKAGQRTRDSAGLNRSEHNNQQADGTSRGGTAGQRIKGLVGLNRNKHDDEQKEGASNGGKADRRIRGFGSLNRKKQNRELDSSRDATGDSSASKTRSGFGAVYGSGSTSGFGTGKNQQSQQHDLYHNRSRGGSNNSSEVRLPPGTGGMYHHTSNQDRQGSRNGEQSADAMLINRIQSRSSLASGKSRGFESDPYANYSYRDEIEQLQNARTNHEEILQHLSGYESTGPLAAWQYDTHHSDSDRHDHYGFGLGHDHDHDHSHHDHSFGECNHTLEDLERRITLMRQQSVRDAQRRQEAGVAAAEAELGASGGGHLVSTSSHGAGQDGDADARFLSVGGSHHQQDSRASGLSGNSGSDGRTSQLSYIVSDNSQRGMSGISSQSSDYDVTTSGTDIQAMLARMRQNNPDLSGSGNNTQYFSSSQDKGAHQMSSHDHDASGTQSESGTKVNFMHSQSGDNASHFGSSNLQEGDATQSSTTESSKTHDLLNRSASSQQDGTSGLISQGAWSSSTTHGPVGRTFSSSSSAFHHNKGDPQGQDTTVIDGDASGAHSYSYQTNSSTQGGTQRGAQGRPTKDNVFNNVVQGQSDKITSSQEAPTDSTEENKEWSQWSL